MLERSQLNDSTVVLPTRRPVVCAETRDSVERERAPVSAATWRPLCALGSGAPLLAKLVCSRGSPGASPALEAFYGKRTFFTSSTPHGGSSSNDESERSSDSEKSGLEDLMFVDSSQQDISGGRWGDWEEDGDSGDGWRSQLAWLSNIVDTPVTLYNDALPPGDMAEKYNGSTSGRSVIDIVTGLLKSTAGMQEWGLADITLGLYLLSLRHSAEMAADTVHGKKMTSDFVVQEWIYHLEIAWGAYMKDPPMLARVSMLEEDQVIKFINRASVMRPAYYIAVDRRHDLVILAIRGTQSIHDVVTDLSSDSDHAEKFDGEAVHYGSVEAARWFLRFEVDTLRECLAENEGFRLLLTGHSLGGATAALLGMMLRKDSHKLLGLCPSKIKAVGIGTPPCVSRSLASKCRDTTSTLVLQDDVIPRVSTAALVRLRNEILGANWNDILKEGVERKGLVDLVASTIEALTSVQDAARKYGAIARRSINFSEVEKVTSTTASSSGDLEKQKQELMGSVQAPRNFPELVAPGTLFHICSREIKTPEFNRSMSEGHCTLWKGDVDSYLGRIVVSPNMFADHRCENYYYSLRDVLKGITPSKKVTLF